jgi:hypothetical protein
MGSRKDTSTHAVVGECSRDVSATSELGSPAYKTPLRLPPSLENNLLFINYTRCRTERPSSCNGREIEHIFEWTIVVHQKLHWTQITESRLS